MGSLGIQEIVEVNVTENWSTPSSVLPLMALNHVSFVCKSIKESVNFYVNVMGFMLVKRPSSFDFEGAWLFNYGIGIHLLQSNNAPTKKEKINPKDNHISFQCTNVELVMQKLKQNGIEYATATVLEGGITVDQLFFHDPDGYMVEICNCQNLPVLPLSACPIKLPSAKNTIKTPSKIHGKQTWERKCSTAAADKMMENFLVDMFNISI
ncbi:hypothetical protein ACFE04_024048 [Oxalis oulophora]